MKRSTTRPGIRWLQRALEAGLDFLFPPRCAGCGRLGSIWCPDCDVRLIRAPVRMQCRTCGFPKLRRKDCPACAIGGLKLRSYAAYRPPLKQAVLKLKYSPNKALAAQMAAWLVELYHTNMTPAELIVPVPLGDVRRRERGYNQVDLIASAMAGILDIPVQTAALARVQETRSQVGLDPSERFVNVSQAFVADPNLIKGQKVLLIDDLVTSGATLLGCAAALIDAGAPEVFCLTVGRTIR